jgi:hypothetical protein
MIYMWLFQMKIIQINDYDTTSPFIYNTSILHQSILITINNKK